MDSQKKSLVFSTICVTMADKLGMDLLVSWLYWSY